MSYFNSIVQNVKDSTSNNSTANLAAGATFTGTGESTLGVAGIQVNLKTDQNCTIYVDQSLDNSNWDIVDTYTYYYSEGGKGFTVQATASYFRVRVKNDGAATTTYFRLGVALCPIVEAVPRSLDESLNLKVHLYGDDDHYGFEAENTPIGEKRVIIPIRLSGRNFEGGTLDTNFWASASANGGAVTQGNAQALLSTNAASPNGSATLYSVTRARYVSGVGMRYRAVVQLAAAAVNNKRRWGIAYGVTMPTITDGAWFQLDGSTFSIVTMKGGVESKVDSGSFNGTLGATYDPSTTVKTYEIYWTNSKVYFAVAGRLLHTVSASSATWADTMNFYIYSDNVNSGGLQANYTLACRVASIARLGNLLTQPSYKYQTGIGTTVCKLGLGNLHRVIISSVGTSGAVITLYDNTIATGTIIHRFTVTFPGGGNYNPVSFDFGGLAFLTGLTLDITTQSANVTVIYE